MDLTQLANLGEFIGGVAVLVTLIYLALEVRRSRAATEALALDALHVGWNSINADLHNNRELMEVFARGSADPTSLDPVDRARFLSVIQCYVNHFQTATRRNRSGSVPREEWKAHAAGFANFLNSPGGRWACNESTMTKEVREVLQSATTTPEQHGFFRGEA